MHCSTVSRTRFYFLSSFFLSLLPFCAHLGAGRFHSLPFYMYFPFHINFTNRSAVPKKVTCTDYNRYSITSFCTLFSSRFHAMLLPSEMLFLRFSLINPRTTHFSDTRRFLPAQMPFQTLYSTSLHRCNRSAYKV